MRPVPPELLDFIDRHGPFYIIGHKEPDGDCIGSQLALASFLRRNGKNAYLCSAGPFSRTEIMPYESRFLIEAPPERPSERAAAIILDCSSLKRIGSVAETLPKVPIAFIDHHAAGTATGDAIYIDDRAPSVTAMILLLIEAMGGIPTKEEAEYLFFGLGTDTGFFRHLDEHSEGDFPGGFPPRLRRGFPEASLQSHVRGQEPPVPQADGRDPHADGTSFRRRSPYLLRDSPGPAALWSREQGFRYFVSAPSRDSGLRGRDDHTTGGRNGLHRRSQGPGSDRRRFDRRPVRRGGHRLAAGLSIRGGLEEVKNKLKAAFEPWFDEA